MFTLIKMNTSLSLTWEQSYFLIGKWFWVKYQVFSCFLSSFSFRFYRKQYIINIDLSGLCGWQDSVPRHSKRLVRSGNARLTHNIRAVSKTQVLIRMLKLQVSLHLDFVLFNFFNNTIVKMKWKKVCSFFIFVCLKLRLTLRDWSIYLQASVEN